MTRRLAGLLAALLLLTACEVHTGPANTVTVTVTAPPSPSTPIDL